MDDPAASIATPGPPRRSVKIASKKDIQAIAGIVAVLGFGYWLISEMTYDRDHPPWYQNIAYDQAVAALKCVSDANGNFNLNPSQAQEECQKTLDIYLFGCKSKYEPDPDQVYGCQYEYMKKLGLVDHPTPIDKP